MKSYSSMFFRALFLVCSLMLLLALGACTPSSSDPQPSEDLPPKDGGDATEQPPEQTPQTPTAPTVKYTGYDTPCIVQTLYTEQNIVADVVVTDHRFQADPTGEKDATKAINSAISAVYAKGGGTVYLPAGKYKVTGTIKVLPFVSLVGDYNEAANTDGSGEYGTVILACPESVDADFPALFEIGGSGGVSGLVVYYPEQDVNNIKPYPYTFNIPGSTAGAAYYMLPSIVDCTVINGYRGISATGGNEQMNIRRIRGTFLYRALHLDNSADASVIEYVDASPEYWVSCPYDEVTRGEITDITSQNTAFVFATLEWVSMRALSCTDYKVGIQTVEGPRTQFGGMLYDCHIVDCDYGLIVDSVDARMGYGIALTGGELLAYEEAVVNNTAGKIQLTGVIYEGGLSSGSGADIVINEQEPPYYPESDAKEPVAENNLVVVQGADAKATKDCSAAIQTALDSLAGKGGIVYLPAGYYLLENPLTVPDGVELRGAGYLPVRDQMELSLGTVIFSHYGRDCDDPATAQAHVTLGKGSGLRNIRLVNAAVNVLGEYMENGNKFTACPYMIRGTGAGAYVIGGSFAGAIGGIEMINADGYYIAHMSASAYDTVIRVDNSDGGYIASILTNVTVGFRHRWWGLSNYDALFPNGWEENFEVSIGRDPDAYATVQLEMDELTQLEYIDSDDCFAVNVFSYGAKHTIEATNSTIEAVNIGKDCYWKYVVEDPMILLHENAELYVCNQHRFNGTSYEKDDSAELSIYTRVTIGVNEGCVE
ncbi:MAG: hypothetical protein IJW40_00125 [Clostridia bacterium]|nr:hypothetical protein [Clostridia bacterium]